MKFIIVGLWAVAVTLGAGFAAGAIQLPSEQQPAAAQSVGIEYTSLPTLSVPVLHQGGVAGYVVVRMVYTADAATLNQIASKPDPFLTDEIFRALYGSMEMTAGRLQPIDFTALADGVRARVNARMGDEVVGELLVHGLNYISADELERGPAAQRQPVASAPAAAPARAAPAGGRVAQSAAGPTQP